MHSSWACSPCRRVSSEAKPGSPGTQVPTVSRGVKPLGEAMRYDASEFLKLRWRQSHEQPRGTRARDFVGHVTGDPRPVVGQSPSGMFPPLDLGRPLSGAAPLSHREGR